MLSCNCTYLETGMPKLKTIYYFNQVANLIKLFYHNNLLPFQSNTITLCYKEWHFITMVKVYIVWQNLSSWEWILRHQRDGRIQDPPSLIDSLFVLLICITKNTQVSIFTNGHFQPMPFPFLSYAPSLTLLIGSSHSLSLPLHLTPPLFSLLWFHINTPMILWDSIIE